MIKEPTATERHFRIACKLLACCAIVLAVSLAVVFSYKRQLGGMDSFLFFVVLVSLMISIPALMLFVSEGIGLVLERRTANRLEWRRKVRRTSIALLVGCGSVQIGCWMAFTASGGALGDWDSILRSVFWGSLAVSAIGVTLLLVSRLDWQTEHRDTRHSQEVGRERS